MKPRFLSRYALLILLVIFFLAPFSMRGARMALEQMKNDVKDWLPSTFKETTELDWFRSHFLDEQFVLITWPECREDNQKYQLLVNKLKANLAPASSPDSDLETRPKDAFENGQIDMAAERERARAIGDTYGLSFTGDYHRNWGDRDEKWLQGDKGKWYFITPQGKLYRWDGGADLQGFLTRTAQRGLGNKKATGELLSTFSSDRTPNEFYSDPRKVSARFFKTVKSGPEVLAMLSEQNGPLWPIGDYSQEEKEEIALEMAQKRLAGTLFGPDGEQTCIILTLSEVGRRDLRRVLGRPIMGKPAGTLLQIAISECGIPLEDLKMGGPPVDNVAIDEEGQITLLRLIGFCVALGLGISLLCFRSVSTTMMVFFVGGLSAVTSLGVVWWVGWTVDAVLLSMPSLVYVLGLSGAVHIVNYYRDAVREHGLEGAPGKALALGWKPCTLAAFTTAIGLLSLCTSNLVPIFKFGLFSAIGVVATLAIMFSFLPAALFFWPPRQIKKKEPRKEPLAPKGMPAFWVRFGAWIIRRHWWVTSVSLVVIIIVGLGLGSIKTSVQLLKMFDPKSKIIRDYTWLEANLGKLVPMELVVRVTPSMMAPTAQERKEQESRGEEDASEALFQLNFLERMEIAARIQSVVETQFSKHGNDIIGQGSSASSFAPELPAPGYSMLFKLSSSSRGVYRRKLEQNRDRILAEEYLRIEEDTPYQGSELWRVSLRLGALNDTDYGEFVGDLKAVVEPVLSAYQRHEEILRGIDDLRKADGKRGFIKGKVCLLGAADPRLAAKQDAAAAPSGRAIDQTEIFAQTLQDLLINRGVQRGVRWIDPEAAEFEENWEATLANYECIVLINGHPKFDKSKIQEYAKVFVDARDHRFDPLLESKTAAQRNDKIQVVYTGVIPVVYKAQATLLVSLKNSIAWAFVFIALVMMVLLRRDRFSPIKPWTWLNARGGIISMVPNVFPVVLIFGAMGHLGILIDIGTMMTASVAMGVAVDDTIHFLSWFRSGIAQGMSRNDAILLAYRRVATAMTQTTAIGGLGLGVFMFSTFTPTQHFGVLMLTLLVTALVGDLVLLPAILAGPLGKYFCPRTNDKKKSNMAAEEANMGDSLSSGDATVRKPLTTPRRAFGYSGDQSSAFHRRDSGHNPLNKREDN